MLDENETRDRFAQLRESDRMGAPSFAQTYARARSRQTWRSTRRLRPLAIAAAAAVVIAAVWLANSRSVSPSNSTETIATWRAPTDVLLTTPGSEMLAALPALNKSILDKMIAKPSNKGT
jgi:hypothetical protein